MRRARVLVVSCCLAANCVVSAFAASRNQKGQTTKVVFTAPVEIPRRVLPAGSYLFTLVPGDPEHNLVQVWTADRQHLIATDLTVPDYTLHPAGNTTLKFDMTKYSAEPDALRAWFYPGDEFGHEFVYSEDRAKDIASRSGRSVLAMSNELAANITKPATSAREASVIAMEKATVEAITPSGQPVDKSRAFESMTQGAPPVPVTPH